MSRTEALFYMAIFVIAFASQSALRRRAERERDMLRQKLTEAVARTTPPAGGGSIQPHPTKDGVFVLAIEMAPRHIDALREWGRRTFPPGAEPPPAIAAAMLLHGVEQVMREGDDEGGPPSEQPASTV